MSTLTVSTIDKQSPKKIIPFHPLGFAIYPILALAAANLAHSAITETQRALLVSSLAALFLLGLLWLITRNLLIAGGLTTLITALFFLYGHIHGLTSKETDSTIWFSIVWGALLVSCAWWIATHPNKMKSITKSLNAASIILILFPLFTIVSYQIETLSPPSPIIDEIPLTDNSSDTTDQTAETLPDIYYIILDGYGRQDVLADIYDYDNQPIIDYLEGRGFYVAKESYSNYNQTFHSIPSSLNMAHINDLMDVEPTTPYDHNRHLKLIFNNRVFNILEKEGYELVAFNTGHGLTSITNADHYLRPEGEEEDTNISISMNLLGNQVFLTPFETLLLETTALRPFMPFIFQSVDEPEKYETQRQRITFTFEHLADFAQEEGNYFVFAHIIAPHPPFVFEADGEPKINYQPYAIADGSHWIGHKGSRAEYISGYRSQINHVNTLLIAAIEEILAPSVTPPIIIIQADHGPGAYFEWNSIDKTNHTERMAILNAYYFPGGDEGLLYPTITPVNTFRAVFNRYFNQNMELLEDVSYFADWSTPYDFIDLTDMLGE